MAEVVMVVKESLKCDSDNEIKSHWCGWWRGRESKGGKVTHLLTSLNLKVLRSLYYLSLFCPRKEKNKNKKTSEQWSWWMNQVVQGPGVRLRASRATGRKGVELQQSDAEGKSCVKDFRAFRGYSIPIRVKKWENWESKFSSGNLISPATGWMPIKAEAGTGKLGEQSLVLTTWHLDGWKTWFMERSPWIKEKGLCSLSNHGI